MIGDNPTKARVFADELLTKTEEHHALVLSLPIQVPDALTQRVNFAKEAMESLTSLSRLVALAYGDPEFTRDERDEFVNHVLVILGKLADMIANLGLRYEDRS